MVTTDVNTVTYNGDGSTTAFPFTFKIQDASEINLQLVYADGTVTEITSDFYVDTVTSTVHYPGYVPGAEPPEADRPPKVQTGQKLTIWRDVPMTQEAYLGDKWPFEEIENGLDKLTMICQQIYSYTNRKLDAALASMFQLAGIVTDSDKLQHITDQYNAIDAKAATATAKATAAANSATAAANSATSAANSASSAQTTATALTNFLETKETLTAPAVDPTLSITGAAADAKVTGIGIEEGLFPAPVLTWEEGGIDSTTGAEATATSSRTVGYTSTTDADVVVNNGSGANIFYYNLESGSYVYKTNAYIAGGYTHKEINKTYGYFRVRMLGSYSSGNYNKLKTYKNNKAITEINNIKPKIQGVYQSPMYAGSGRTISWTQKSNKMSLSFVDSIEFLFEGYPGNTYLISKDDILSAATAAGYTVEGNTISGLNYAIIYNISTKTVSVVDGSTYEKNLDEVILFRSYFGSYVSGLIVDYEIRRRYEATQNRISALETAVGSGSTMPSYWLTYMQTKIADVKDKDVLVGRHGDSFVFITDIHYEFNDKKSAPLVKYVLNNSSVNRVVCGGDVISGGGTNTKASALAWLDKARNSFRNIGINPLYLRGNHDNNTEISPPNPSIAISDSELYGILWKPIENEITMGDELNYYFDNPAQKIRYICLDTGHPDTNVMSDAQITWMQNRITELDSGWSVLVLTHQFYGTPPTMDGNGTKIKAGLDAIYDTANATIIGVICGHSHRDYMETTSKGYPVICTTCDIRAGEGGGTTRTAGTITEQAFDVFHIDFTNRMIYATRIGAGSDRSVSF